MLGFLLSLAIHATASEVPFYNREVKDLRDVGALNENSRALADGIRKADLTSGGTITSGSLCFPDGTCQTAAGAVTTLPTRQIFTSSSGTYTTPTGARQLKIRMVAGGGGGGASITNNGSNGNATKFNNIVVSSGIGGVTCGASSCSGGIGGSGGAGGSTGVFASSSIFRVNGGGGGGGGATPASPGGNSAFGGGAASGEDDVDAYAGAANTGGGGGGAGDVSTGRWATAGGAGEYAEIIIKSPAATYIYTVGAGGAGGAAGTQAGGAGGSGIIIVDELY